MITTLLCLVLLVLDRTGHEFTTKTALWFAAFTLILDGQLCLAFIQKPNGGEK